MTETGDGLSAGREMKEPVTWISSMSDSWATKEPDVVAAAAKATAVASFL